MDMEISIRTGKRRRHNSGTVKWNGQKDDSHLVTYGVGDEIGAIREALFQVERMLRDSLRLYSMQSEDA